MFYVGIDPGKTGAIVVLDEDGDLFTTAQTPLLGKEYDVRAMTALLRRMAPDAVKLVGLEDVHSMPGEGVRSAFTFGFGCGLWEGMLSALELPYRLVRPQAWQTGWGLPRGAKRDDLKAAVAARAKRRWPTLALPTKKSWGLADAAMIAEWARTRGVNHEGA